MIRPTTTVYSCYTPRVAEAVSRALASFDHATLLRANITPGLDDLHLPLIEDWQRVMIDDSQIQSFNSLPWKYFTSGASEGIYHLLARHGRSELPLYQLKGEYQGYGAYAQALGLEFIDVRREEVGKLEKGLFFLSDPSAIDGNALSLDLIEEVLNKHQLVLDLAYLGMSDPLHLDLSHPNLTAIVTSLSKPYGLYYYRAGFTMAREEVPSLMANKWFKNALSIHIAREVLKLPLSDLRAEGEAWQEKAVRVVSEELEEVEAADVYLLARGAKSDALREFWRGDSARLCLTPFFYDQLYGGRESA